MSSTLHRSPLVPSIGVLALILAQLACKPVLGETPAPTATTPPTTEPIPAGPIAPVETQSAVPTTALKEAPSLPDQPLSGSGPWYVFMCFTAAHEVWAMNPDGSGLTMLWSYFDEDENPFSEDFILSPAPSGGLLAVLQYDRNLQSAPVLSLVELPSGNMQTIANLLPREVDHESLALDARSAADQVWAAVGALNNLAWSPDGRWLAFNAAIDGPSADVYVYDTTTEKIERLTDGPNQSTDLVWSPDGGYVVHNVVDSLYYGYSGIGYGMLGAWAVRPEPGSSAIRLYDHTFHGFEEILGWLDDHRHLGDSFDGESLGNCGYFNLRSVDIQEGEGPILFAGHYSWRAFDPNTRRMALVLSSVLSEFECNTSLDPGVYLFDVELQESRLVPEVDPEPIMGVTWSEEAGLFFLTGGEELIAIDPDGNVERYPSVEYLLDTEPVVAPGGDMWALGDAYDAALAVGTRTGELVKIEVGEVEEAEEAWHPFWSLDGTWLFFFADGMHLTAAPAPDFDPLVVIQKGLLGSGSPVLVNP